MLQVSRRSSGDVALVDVTGPIDGGAGCRAIHEAIRRELESGRRHFVLNLGGVPWVNSLGAGFLVAASVSAHRERAVVRLAGLNERVADVLGAIGVVPQVWQAFPDEDQALHSLGGRK